MKTSHFFLYLSPVIGVIIGSAGIIFGAYLPSISSIQDRWDRATVVKICCDGTKVFQMDDGEYRVRTHRYSYHAANADVCVR